jgi:hypothetical protein
MPPSPLWRRQNAPVIRRCTSTRLHDAISQKAVIFILTAVRSWNLTFLKLFVSKTQASERGIWPVGRGLKTRELNDWLVNQSLIHWLVNQSSISNTISWYRGRKITASLGNVTLRGEKYGKGKGGAGRPRVCLSTYSITENMYYS